MRVVVITSPGITPACAGKSKKEIKAGKLKGDHPRMRGEKNETNLLQKGETGSPPHARGKVGNSGVDPKQKGITPACAGKRQIRRMMRLYWRDHPRMRGEKVTIWSFGALPKGSPPHAPGKV